MKLKKAIDKAKQERGGAREAAPEDGTLEATAKPHNMDWQAPTYTKSAHVNLDLRVLELNRCVGMFPESPEIEFYKILRTQILHRTKDKNWNTIMVTSVQPGEGKTLTAINLSLTFAKAFSQTVLLVDCDLRQQRIHHYLGIPSDKGLTNVLLDDIPMSDVIRWPGIDKLTVISGGKTMQDSSEILGSPRMRKLVAEMKNRYEDRYVIFDTSPLLTGADAIAFAPLVDGIIVVAEEGRTSMSDITKAFELIPKEKVLGFVLNKQRFIKKERYQYGH